MSGHVDLAAFADALSRAPSPRAMEGVLARGLSALGIDGYDFFCARRDGLRRPEAGSSYYARSTLPAELDDAYFTEGWYDECPVVALAFGPPRPRTAAELFAAAAPGSSQAVMWQAMRDFEIEHELYLPLSDDERIRQVNIYMTGRGPTAAAHFEAARHMGQALATGFIWAYEDAAVRSRQPAACGRKLTPREAECLKWAAAGLTTAAIAEKLGVRPRTVKFHVTNAVDKLGASSRTQAVAKALRLGLIAL